MSLQLKPQVPKPIFRNEILTDIETGRSLLDLTLPFRFAAFIIRSITDTALQTKKREMAVVYFKSASQFPCSD
jgi:hypothetical protein